MTYEPHLITPFIDSGLKKYYKPFIIGEQAFPDVQNAYTWRGSVRKREGYEFHSKLPNGDAPVQGIKKYIQPSSLAEKLVAFSPTKSYLFSDSSLIFTDISFYAAQSAAIPAGTAISWSGGTNDFFWASNFAGSLWVTNNIVADHIRYWNGTAGALGVSGGWNILQPIVNGSTTLDASLLILPYKGRLVALNTVEGGISYPSRARWSQLGSPYAGDRPPTAITAIAVGNPTIITSPGHGLYNGQKVYITGINGTAGDRVLNEMTVVATFIDANTISVPIDTTGKTYTGSGFLQGQGIPFPTFNNSGGAWRDTGGRGGFNDADTSERIVTADIIKDTLIVFFQRSTWRLRYTGNEELPFIWERLNTQYGAESTYSNIAFDEVILAYSRFGWVESDTNDVHRIDLDIPDESFGIESTDVSFAGMSRVQGIRDFYRQFAYWCFPTIGSDVPNRIYAYNYVDKKWFIFTPTIPMRVFGSYRSNKDVTWADLNAPGPNPSADSWENYSSADDQWKNYGTGDTINFPFVLGGDANGNLYKMFEFFSAPTTDNGTPFGFSVSTKSFNPYFPQGLKCKLAYLDLYCTTIKGGEIQLQHFVDDKTNAVITKAVTLYQRAPIFIANIIPGNPTIVVTQGSHYLTNNEIVPLSGIVGPIGLLINNINFFTTVLNSTTFTLPVDTNGYTYQGSGMMYKGRIPQGQATYTRIYLGATAHFHQLTFGTNAAVLLDPIKGPAEFEMQALVLWTRPEGRIRG